MLVNTYPITVSRDLIFASKKTTLLSQAATIGASVEAADNLAAGSISQVMQILDTSEIDGVVVTDAEALLLYDSRDNLSQKYAERFQRSTGEAFAGNDYFESSFRNGEFKSVAAVPIMRGGAVVGAVLVYQDDPEQGAMIMELRANIMRISAAVTLAAVFLCVFLARTLSNRMMHILKAIKSVREGEYSYRIDVTGHDEVTQLAAEFNSLTDRLQRTEEVRRRFVSDASHELKTPLASIRLLADSISQNSGMDRETVCEFVGDIGNEAERLARITDKLLALTRLDNNVISKRECVDMRDILKRALQLLRPLAEVKNITISQYMSGDCTVLASEDDIFQIILNLVENAVKYNVESGSVDVHLNSEVGDVTLKVEDTGIGIPDEDLPHIFDRFYRVDKARAREAGGSGLGLSIVHSAVVEHGGTVTAEHREDGGMRFTVVFPHCPVKPALNITRETIQERNGL